MVKNREKFPKEGEFIVGKVTDIEKQYVYVDLIDYEGLDSEEFARGMIHISEISSRWIKNVRNFVRNGQRVVLRVLGVDVYKGHVDLSLRRVSSGQKENRMKEWKYALKYENLLQFLTESDGIDLTLDQAYDLIGFPVLDLFDSYQEAVEGLKENGEELLSTIKEIPSNVKDVLLKIIDENVKISTVNISGRIKLTFTSENGIDLIKETLLECLTVIESTATRNIQIYYIAAPFYRLEIESKDYIDAENILSDILEITDRETTKNDGIVEFIRD